VGNTTAKRPQIITFFQLAYLYMYIQNVTVTVVHVVLTDNCLPADSWLCFQRACLYVCVYVSKPKTASGDMSIVAWTTT